MGQSSKQDQPKGVQSIAGPKGTRDLYPDDALRRRYITQAWRDASIRAGFEEIEGPTLEASDLYSIKSGEGILSELFQVYSGKSEREIEQVRDSGRAPYAMRPEFTPTLARMYAARAKQLPKPCRWFSVGPYFRAERPQRGRLREFLQWNLDTIGLPGETDTPETRAQMDAETIECLLNLLGLLGIEQPVAKVQISHREFVAEQFKDNGIGDDQLEPLMHLLDSAQKLPIDTIETRLGQLGVDKKLAQFFKNGFPAAMVARKGNEQKVFIHKPLAPLWKRLDQRIRSGAVGFDSRIVRGLAYYTGTVFEAIAEGERAVAGGGRYDNLIELLGGPPTPAVGFAMGDVVLGNLLDDLSLMPEGPDLLDAISRAPASARPDAFVVPNGDEDLEPLAPKLASQLRSGVENESWSQRDGRKPWDKDRYRVEPLHARTSSKSTRNLKKLRADAEKQHARFFVEIHGPDKVELTDMDRRESLTSDVGSFNLDPQSPSFVGDAVQRAIDSSRRLAR